MLVSFKGALSSLRLFLAPESPLRSQDIKIFVFTFWSS